eukprot:NODE_391_length_1550_cov_180.762159_g284_i0.p1 GENE.NODE_391_length_1550_cov_180.762159_g284_i0~~NODE_391_length_1550_cov_180.762159_g284_i0.p1  ORF type:complete len:368 (-),score=85.18 NODE_391_length_1550_cov_180.762159_g284_i0:308-1411(-)
MKMEQTRTARMEESRAARIFDVKTRTIGIDRDALDEQVAEKQRIKDLEKTRDRFLDEQRVAMDQHATFLTRESEKARAQKQIAVDQYRNTYQKKDMRREWDLNNPRRVIDDLPPRIGDEDPRCGAASMQMFDGEDLSASERRRAQADQLKRWVQQQVDERDTKKWLEKDQDRELEERAEEMNQKAYDLEQSVRKQRQQVAAATADFNKQMAEAKRQETMLAKGRTTLQNLQEIQSHLDSDLMTENHMATLNATDPNRFRRDHFKGLSPAQQQAILNEQVAQREELKRRREREAEDDRAWSAHEAQQLRLGTNLERQRNRERRESAMEVAQEQKRQAAEAALRRARERDLYRGEITEDFMGKFNSCSR